MNARTALLVALSVAGCSAAREIAGADRVPARERLAVGVVTTLDEELFSRDRIHDGLVDPVDAPRPVGFGIFFLQPYDPRKIPVLFVHGISASPLDFRDALPALDLERYQPWVMSYPSGMRLAVVAEVLSEQLVELHERLHSRPVVVVAHSMGGLVSRAAILRLSREGRADLVQKFISISTPYGGQPTAALGVRHARQPVPAWTDLSPGSDFLRDLESPLPPTLPFYLIFSYGSHGYDEHGDNRHFWDLARWFSVSLFAGSNDSSVTLSTQLALYAQRGATQTMGFDVDHVSILSLPDALECVAGLLDRHATQASALR